MPDTCIFLYRLCTRFLSPILFRSAVSELEPCHREPANLLIYIYRQAEITAQAGSKNLIVLCLVMVSIFTIFFRRQINLIKPIILNCLLDKFIICPHRCCSPFNLVFRILLLSSNQSDSYLKSVHPSC